MALIGFRSPLTYHPWPWDEYTEEQKKMFNVRPGITGWAQVNGRKTVEWHKRIALNVWYDVKILGTRNDVNELLQAADIFVLPSRFEGLGIALVESQAAGLPTFTTKDVVPDDVKITDLLEFVPVNASAKEWATRILCADTMTRKNMGNQVRMAGYDNYENAKNLESLYLSFLNSK